MVEISLSGSGEGPGWATAPGYSTAAFSATSDRRPAVQLGRAPLRMGGDSPRPGCFAEACRNAAAELGPEVHRFAVGSVEGFRSLAELGRASRTPCPRTAWRGW